MKKNVKEIEIKLDKEWTSALDAVFKKKQKDVKVDGFRKGAVPKEVYLKKVGIESLYMDAIDASIQVAYKKALEETKLIPEVEPGVDIKDINENSVTFKFTIITKPEIKLGEYKNLKIKKEKVAVSAEEVNEEVKHLQSHLAEIVIKEDGEVVLGNTAVIDFDGTVDGKALEGGSGKDYPLEIGSNTFIPGFETGIVGMKVGDSKELNLKFPENYTEELKNKDVIFKVTVKEIKERVLPDLNEDFYKDLGYDDVKNEEEFKVRVKNELTKKKEIENDDKYLDALLNKSIENLEVDVNEEIIHEEIHRMMHQYEDQLKMQGINLEQFFEFTKTTKEDLEKNMTPEATKRVKCRYLLEAVANKENIEVSEQDVKDYTKDMAAQYNTTESELLAMIGGEDMIKYDLKMRKAMEFIKNN